jgi:site-specific DNA recombinase
MRVAIYARVSTESQEARGTIGSQLETLRKRIAAEGHDLAAEYCDDGCSGARLDRPGLDAVRDAAEAGQIDAVWCLSPDRLARVYAYQVIVVDELARCGVSVLFHDTPALTDDPQTHLLTQVQGVIAEYERAKIAERYRRGKLWRSRAGEVIAWKCSYGYRRVPRTAAQAAHLEIYEAEANVVRNIFRDYVQHNASIRQLTRLLNDEGVCSPSGKDVWGCSTIGRLLRNEAYVGRAYFNRRESIAKRENKKGMRQVDRPREQWIAIAVPAIITEDIFEAAQRISRQHSKWSARRAEAGHWLLRGLIKCGHCHVTVSCHKMRGRQGTVHRYYYCANHDPLRAKGEHRRCPERNIRADELDAFVFEQVRAAMLRPQMLLAGENAIAKQRKPTGDELLGAEVSRFNRKIEAACAERRRIADLYQAGFIDQGELMRRGQETDLRRRTLEAQREALVGERKDLAQKNRLRQRVAGFAEKIAATIDKLDFAQRQQLLRLVVEQVLVKGWQVEIKLRIPLDTPPDLPGGRVSTKDRLRSLHASRGEKLSLQRSPGTHRSQCEIPCR